MCPGRTSTRMISSPYLLAMRWFLVQASQYPGASEIADEHLLFPYLKSRR